MNGEKLRVPVEGLVHSIPMSPPGDVLCLARDGVGIGMDGDDILGVVEVAVTGVDAVTTSLPIARSVKMVEFVGVVMLSKIWRVGVGVDSLGPLYKRCLGIKRKKLINNENIT